MTMICINTQADHAEMLTDSIDTMHNGRKIEAGPHRVTVLPGLDALVCGRGNTIIVDFWADLAEHLAGQVADFDDLIQHVREPLKRYVARCLDDVSDSRTRRFALVDTMLYAVGWSPSARRFKSYVLSGAVEDFAPIDLGGEFYVIPAPSGVKPTDDERRLQQLRGASLAHRGASAAIPTSDEEWKSLAEAVYRSRSLTTDDHRKVPLHGPVVLTRLERGHATQRTVCTLGDDPAEFRLMMHNTMHPVSQLGPCPCGRGRRLMDCHLAVDSPCNCGSGELMRDCCLLDLDSAEAFEWLARYPDLARPAPDPGKVGRNDPCPCGSGAKWKKCCLARASV